MDQGFDKVYTETREELAAHLNAKTGRGPHAVEGEHGSQGKSGEVKSNRKRQADSGSAGSRVDVLESSLKKRRVEEGSSAVTSHPAGCMWYYKFKLEDTQEHGPFTTAQMQEWRKQGYFVGEHAVKLRRDPPFMISGGIHGEGSGDAADDLLEDLQGDDDASSNDKAEWIDSNTIVF